MSNEIEINQSNIEAMLAALGADCVLQPSIRTNLKGNTILTLNGAAGQVVIGEGNGLSELRQGKLNVIVERAADALRINKNDVSATDLLKLPSFRQSSLSEVESLEGCIGNKFLQTTFDFPTDSIPVFYGSTAGINFAEVMETAICAQAIQKRRVKSSVVFDFESTMTTTSNRIFVGSRELVSPDLQERVTEKQSTLGLAAARLQSTQALLDKIPDFPLIQFVDGMEIFNSLVPPFEFTLGQLTLMARIAGRDPDLFARVNLFLKSDVIKKDNLLRGFSSVTDLSSLVSEFMEDKFSPKGFTYYARDARIGQFAGVLGIPIKLTEKANIYKILEPLGSLFSQETGNGGLLLPITRQRIVSRATFNEPIDSIVLEVLSEDQPEGFEKLVRSFRDQCRVLSVDEAVAKGTIDNRFLIEDFFERINTNV